MSIYDIAHHLAREMKASAEYARFMEAKKVILADEGNNKMVRDFQTKQFEIQQAQMLGQVDERQQQELEQLYSLLSLNPKAREYLEAEFELSRIVSDVQKIIGEAIEEALPIGYEDLMA